MPHTVYLEFKCLEGKGAEFLEVLLPSQPTQEHSTDV